MFRIVRFDLLVKYTALATVGLSVFLYSIVQNVWFPGYSVFRVITISSIVCVVIVSIMLTPFFSRKIWAIIGSFNKALFPDLNGTWEGNIILEDKVEIEVRAVIRQSLLATQIDVHGKTMKSITLETTPTIEQGQNKLYYVYRSTPKDPSRPSYNGSTLFDIRFPEKGKKKNIELSGNYYTDRKTIGRIALKKICNNSNKDISYY